MRTIAALFALLALVATARAEDRVRQLFLALEEETDLAEPAAVLKARARLLAADPDFFEAELPPGGLRSALARSMPAKRVLDLLRRTERRAVLVENLAARDDLVGTLLAEGIFTAMIPDHQRLLLDLAEDSLVLGDRAPALVLLGDPRSAEQAAENLADMFWAEGLHLLADVVTGEVTVPPNALASIATALPNLTFYEDRPLGKERIAALLTTARESDDGALRALAARILLCSQTPDTFGAAVAAYRDARTVRIERSEWRKIGSIHERLVADSSVPAWARISVLRGAVQFGYVGAYDHPQDAERSAADVRRLFAETRDPMFRGLLIRELDWLEDHYVDEHGRRKRPVPSFVALLKDLGGRRARSILRKLEREPAPPWRRLVKLPRRERRPRPPAALELEPDRMVRILAGVETSPGLRDLLADWADEALGRLPESLALDPKLVRPLLRALETDPDPEVARLVAGILDLSGAPEARAALLESAERLWAASFRSSPPVPARVGRLRTALEFLERRDVSPYVREAVFRTIFEGEGFDPGRMAAWITEQAPLLDADLPETILPAWLALAEDEEWESKADLIRRAYAEAVTRIPAKGPRTRLTR